MVKSMHVSEVAESERILKLFEDVYQGNSWIGSNMIAILSAISAEQAATRILPNRNSIWEIVNHIIGWRLHVVRRFRGETAKGPDHNYFHPVGNTSESSWKDTLKQLSDTHAQWVAVLRNLKEKDLAETYPANGMSNYEHIHGILHHDIYHLGQIAFLAKSF